MNFALLVFVTIGAIEVIALMGAVLCEWRYIKWWKEKLSRPGLMAILYAALLFFPLPIIAALIAYLW